MGNYMMKSKGGIVKYLVPVVSMLGIQAGFSLMSFLTKFSVNSGFNSFILVTYRQAIASLVLIAPAIIYERTAINGLNKRVLIKLVICSVLGVTLNNSLFNLGLKYSSPTIASAINNIFPALTFIASILFRIEELHLSSMAGRAKILGTSLCVGGAMVCSFYTGFQLHLKNPSVDLSYLNGSSTHKETIDGPLLIALSCIARCGWFLIQNGLNDDFPYPITTTTATSLLSCLQCAVIGLIMEHGRGWSLRSKLRLISVTYSGVFGSAIAYLVTTFFIATKGPVYVAMFNPVSLMLVAVLGWAFLQEKIFFGSLLGSALILIGLFAVLWGNWKATGAETSFGCSHMIAEDLEAGTTVMLNEGVYKQDGFFNHEEI